MTQGADAAIPDRVQSAMQTLAQRRVLREVLEELAARGTPVLVLKGHALAQWLYPANELRTTADIDLLLPGKPHVDGLIAWLQVRDFIRLDGVFAGDMVCFESACGGPHAEGSPVELDLHWRLSTVPVFAFKFEFEELMAASIALPTLHPHARGLGPVHALLHACMHRAQNMLRGNQDEARWLRDIELLGAFFTPSHWDEWLSLAVSHRLAAVCLDGVQAAGTNAAIHVPGPILAQLRTAAEGQGLEMRHMHRWAYVQWQCWRAIPTLGMRLRWLRQRLWPAPRYLRHRHGANAHSSIALRGARLAAGVRRIRGTAPDPGR